MSEVNTDHENDTDDDDEKSPRWYRNQIKEANARAEAAEARATTNEGAARRLAFQEAGLSDAGPAKFFQENYTGPLDVDSIQAKAREHGFLTDDSAEATADLTEIDRQAQAVTGGEAVIVSGSTDHILAQMDEVAANSQPGEESQAIAWFMREHGLGVSE